MLFRHCGCVGFDWEKNISRCTKYIQDDMFDVSANNELALFKICSAYVSILMWMVGWEAMFVLFANSCGKQILPLRLMCNSFSTATSLSWILSLIHSAFEVGTSDIRPQIIRDLWKIAASQYKKGNFHNINPTSGTKTEYLVHTMSYTVKHNGLMCRVIGSWWHWEQGHLVSAVWAIRLLLGLSIRENLRNWGDG